MKLQHVFNEFVSVRKSSTANVYRQKLSGFLTAYGSYDVEDITPEIIEDWFRKLEGKYSEGNMAMYRKSFAAVLNYACPQSNLMTRVRRYSQEPKRIIRADKDDVLTALDLCDELSKSGKPIEIRDAAIFALGTAGARRSNIASLTFSEVKLGLKKAERIGDDLGYIIVCEGGKESMEIILDERRASIVRKYLEIRPPVKHDYLFVSLNNESPSYGQHLSNEGFIRARRRICNLAKIGIISYQEMRRMVGTEIAREHGLETAAEALGHKSGTEVVRKHYYDPDKEKARMAALKILRSQSG